MLKIMCIIFMNFCLLVSYQQAQSIDYSIIENYLRTYNYNLLSEDYRNTISMTDYNQYFKPLYTDERNENIARNISDAVFNIVKYINDNNIYEYKIISEYNSVYEIDVSIKRPESYSDVFYLIFLLRSWSSITDENIDMSALSEYQKKRIDEITEKYAGLVSSKRALEYRETDTETLFFSIIENRICPSETEIHKHVKNILNGTNNISRSVKAIDDDTPSFSDVRAVLTLPLLLKDHNIGMLAVNFNTQEKLSILNKLKIDYNKYIEEYLNENVRDIILRESVISELNRKDLFGPVERRPRKDQFGPVEEKLNKLHEYQMIYNDICNGFNFRNVRISQARGGGLAVFGEYQYNSPVRLSNATAAVNFYDENNRLIGTQDIYFYKEIFDGKIEGFGFGIEDQIMAGYAKTVSIRIKYFMADINDIP